MNPESTNAQTSLPLLRTIFPAFPFPLSFAFYWLRLVYKAAKSACLSGIGGIPGRNSVQERAALCPRRYAILCRHSLIAAHFCFSAPCLKVRRGGHDFRSELVQGRIRTLL